MAQVQADGLWSAFLLDPQGMRRDGRIDPPLIAGLNHTMLKETLLMLAAIMINYAPIWLADRYERNRPAVDEFRPRWDTDSE